MNRAPSTPDDSTKTSAEMQAAAPRALVGSGRRGRLQAIVQPAVTALGFELVGVEFTEGNRRSRLRIYIDSANGINVDDCAKVSHQVSGVLDVEDPVAGQYDLEVSSPGLDRPLFDAEHFKRFAGERVRLRTTMPFDGQRNFTGLLKGMSGDRVVIETEQGDEHAIALTAVRSARLVPQL